MSTRSAGPTDPTSNRKNRKSIEWLALIIVLAATVATVATPAWILQPFRPETATGLRTAYLMRHWSPVITIALVAVILAAMFILWPRSKWWLGKPLLIILLLFSVLLAWFSRQNYFEWIFHPIPSPAYAKAGEADFTAPTDMVIGININDDPVAYPLRQIGYHHVVNDVVGGVPVAVTY